MAIMYESDMPQSLGFAAYLFLALSKINGKFTDASLTYRAGDGNLTVLLHVVQIPQITIRRIQR